MKTKHKIILLPDEDINNCIYLRYPRKFKAKFKLLFENKMKVFDITIPHHLYLVAPGKRITVGNGYYEVLASSSSYAYYKLPKQFILDYITTFNQNKIIKEVFIECNEAGIPIITDKNEVILTYNI